MTTLIRNLRIEQDDYAELEDHVAVPSTGKFIVNIDRLLDHSRLPTAQSIQHCGVKIANTRDISEVWPLLQGLPLIVLEFPTFGDGRAYSQARLLRDRFRFSGELRATGAAVVSDQLWGMLRCGINSFLLRQDQNPADCLKALQGFGAAYQAASDNLQPVLLKRRI